MKKYILLENETIEHEGKTLYRIQALVDFLKVKAGDKGGYIEKEENLSHEGKCWVYNNAKVYDNARISDNVGVAGDAQVYGNARIFGKSIVADNVKVYDNAKVGGSALLLDNAQVYNNAEVVTDELLGLCEDVRVHGGAKIFQSERLFIRGNKEIVS